MNAVHSMGLKAWMRSSPPTQDLGAGSSPVGGGSAPDRTGPDVDRAFSDLGLHRDIHPQVEPDLVQLGADLLERGLAEIADVEELFLALADQVADGGDPLALQAVGGPDGQLELGQAHIELALELGIDGHVL